MLKLNLGCCKTILDGWVNIDLYQYDPRIVVGDIRNLANYANESVDEILAQDVIEHIPFYESVAAVKEWIRTLKIGGQLTVQTTNIAGHLESYAKGFWNLETLNYMLFSGKNWADNQTRDGDFHKSVYDIPFMKNLFVQNGLDVISIVAVPPGTPGQNMNLTIVGVKKRHML